MNDEEIRLECVRLIAVRQLPVADLIEEARVLADFVFGLKDAQIIADARKLAKTISASEAA